VPTSCASGLSYSTYGTRHISPALYIRFAPDASLIPPSLKDSLLSTAAMMAHSAPAPMNTALARLRVAHLSINACVVSPLATPTSTFLSDSEAELIEFFFSMSLLLTGAMNRRVNGTMLGSRTDAATLSLKASDLGSSVVDQQEANKKNGWTVRRYAAYAVAIALVKASGMPKPPPTVSTVCHCFAASGAGACMIAGTVMNDMLAFWPGSIRQT
jgi:hypothetical protein